MRIRKSTILMWTLWLISIAISAYANIRSYQVCGETLVAAATYNIPTCDALTLEVSTWYQISTLFLIASVITTIYNFITWWIARKKTSKLALTSRDERKEGGSQRRNTGLRGSFSLDADTIDDEVDQVSPGVFALGTKEGRIFHVHYVGRSDIDVKAELKENVGKYDRFKFDYTDPYSSDAAFLKECKLYHDFGGPDGKLDNQRHPDRPSDDSAFCPNCGDPTQKTSPTAASVSSPPKLGKQFCVNCGSTLPIGSKFCNKCGTQQQ